MPKTVLVVEDNEMNMKLFNDLLQSSGHNTVQSLDGKNVIELARKHMPDLILMDIQLPDVSGLDLTRQLKAEDDLKHIPVVAVSALAMRGDREKIIEAGCNDYLSKPIDITGFLAKVNEHIE